MNTTQAYIEAGRRNARNNNRRGWFWSIDSTLADFNAQSEPATGKRVRRG